MVCNMCGKEFTEIDDFSGLKVNGMLGYGSKYDGDRIELNLCCDCMDTVIDAVAKNCKHYPIHMRVRKKI